MVCVKKKYERDAELAYWYGVDPSGWDEGKKAAYLWNLPRVKCQQMIQDGNYNPSDYRGVEALYMTAFGDQQMANKARRAAQERYVDEKCKR